MGESGRAIHKHLAVDDRRTAQACGAMRHVQADTIIPEKVVICNGRRPRAMLQRTADGGAAYSRPQRFSGSCENVVLGDYKCLSSEKG